MRQIALRHSLFALRQNKTRRPLWGRPELLLAPDEKRMAKSENAALQNVVATVKRKVFSGS